jgi:hypothetical protein
MGQNKEIENTGDSSCSDYGLARFPFNGNVPSVMDGIAQRKSRPGQSSAKKPPALFRFRKTPKSRNRGRKVRRKSAWARNRPNPRGEMAAAA